jgi:hypothetical protein
MSHSEFHPQVKRLLDGEISLAELPPELRAEGKEALALLAGIDRSPVQTHDMTARVMRALQRAPGRRSTVRRLIARSWVLVPTLAAAAMLILSLGRTTSSRDTTSLVTVRFVLLAPTAHTVSVAGTFNEWDAAATPLVRSGSDGVWTATLALPAGQHQYAFVVDGAQWVPDPGAPAVADGFGRRNSILAL